jgi:hypothetical protein
MWLWKSGLWPRGVIPHPSGGGLHRQAAQDGHPLLSGHLSSSGDSYRWLCASTLPPANRTCGRRSMASFPLCTPSAASMRFPSASHWRPACWQRQWKCSSRRRRFDCKEFRTSSTIHEPPFCANDGIVMTGPTSGGFVPACGDWTPTTSLVMPFEALRTSFGRSTRSIELAGSTRFCCSRSPASWGGQRDLGVEAPQDHRTESLLGALRGVLNPGYLDRTDTRRPARATLLAAQCCPPPLSAPSVDQPVTKNWRRKLRHPRVSGFRQTPPGS